MSVFWAPFCRATGAAMLAMVLPAQAAQIALIIDDLGDNRGLGERFVDLPGPVAGAFLPSSPHTERLAVAAHAAGKEVLLHLPMEATRRAVSHPDAITLEDDAETLSSIVLNGLDKVPHASGLNNHQGSALTQDAERMQWLMRVLADNGGVYFIDSMTSGRSVGLRTAREHGLATARRDVFLDNVRTHAAIDKQFQRLLRLARSRGRAVGIGHPYPETFAYLEAKIPTLAEAGITLVPVSSVVGADRPVIRAASAAPPQVNSDGARLAALQAKLDAANSELASLRATREQVEQAPPVSASALETVKNELTASNAALVGLREQNQQLQQALSAAQARTADLLADQQSDAADQNAKRDGLARTLADTQQRLRDREQQIQALYTRNEAADAQQAALARELATAREALAGARRGSTQAQDALAAEQQRNDALAAALAASRADNQQLRASNAELADAKQRLAQLTSNLADRESALRTAQAEMAQLQAQLTQRTQAASTRLTAAEAEVSQLRQQNAALVERLATQQRAVETAREASRAANDRAASEHAQLVEQLETARRQVTNLQGGLEQAEAQLAQQQVQRANAEQLHAAEVAQLASKLAERDNSVHAQAGERDALQLRIARLEAALLAAEESALVASRERDTAATALAGVTEKLERVASERAADDRQLAEMTEQLAAARRAQDERSAKIAALNAQVERLTASLDASDENLRQQAAIAANRTGERNDLRQQLVAAQRRVEAQDGRIEALRRQVSDAALAARDQQALARQLRTERDVANQRLEQLQGEQLQLSTSLTAARKDTAQIAAENRELRKRLLRVQAQPAQAADAGTRPTRFQLDPGGG